MFNSRIKSAHIAYFTKPSSLFETAELNSIQFCYIEIMLNIRILLLNATFQVVWKSNLSQISDSANDMNTNAYKAAIHKVHERTIYEPSNALPFYVRDCGGGWACFESRHKDWRFYYLSVNTRYTEPEVVMEWSLNPMVSSDMKW